jgi:hypothetical protein
MTVKQRRLIKGLASGQSNVSALREAGYAEGTVRAGLTALVGGSKPLREAIGKSMARQGISDRMIFGQVKEGLQATAAVALKLADDPLAPPIVIERPDHKTRHGYVETACRLKGYLGRESADDAGDTPGAVTIVFNGPVQAAGYAASLTERERVTQGVMVASDSAESREHPTRSANTDEPAHRVMGAPPVGGAEVPAITGQRTAASDKKLSDVPRRRGAPRPSAHERSMAEVERFLDAEAAAGRA